MDPIIPLQDLLANPRYSDLAPDKKVEAIRNWEYDTIDKRNASGEWDMETKAIFDIESTQARQAALGIEPMSPLAILESLAGNEEEDRKTTKLFEALEEVEAAEREKREINSLKFRTIGEDYLDRNLEVADDKIRAIGKRVGFTDLENARQANEVVQNKRDSAVVRGKLVIKPDLYFDREAFVDTVKNSSATPREKARVLSEFTRSRENLAKETMPEFQRLTSFRNFSEEFATANPDTTNGDVIEAFKRSGNGDWEKTYNAMARGLLSGVEGVGYTGVLVGDILKKMGDQSGSFSTGIGETLGLAKAGSALQDLAIDGPAGLADTSEAKQAMSRDIETLGGLNTAQKLAEVGAQLGVQIFASMATGAVTALPGAIIQQGAKKAAKTAAGNVALRSLGKDAAAKIMAKSAAKKLNTDEFMSMINTHLTAFAIPAAGSAGPKFYESYTRHRDKLAASGLAGEELEEAARSNALTDATRSGIVTGVVTRIFGLHGVEGIGRLTQIAANPTARKALSVSAKQFAKQVGKGSVGEGFEEALDEGINGALDALLENPDMTFAQWEEQVLFAGFAGTVFGAAVEVPKQLMESAAYVAKAQIANSPEMVARNAKAAELREQGLDGLADTLEEANVATESAVFGDALDEIETDVTSTIARIDEIDVELQAEATGLSQDKIQELHTERETLLASLDQGTDPSTYNPEAVANTAVANLASNGMDPAEARTKVVSVVNQKYSETPVTADLLAAEAESVPVPLPPVEGRSPNEEAQVTNEAPTSRNTDLFPDSTDFAGKLPSEANIKSYTENEGIGTAIYENPENGSEDVFISAFGDNDFVAYIRIYDEQGNPTNRFASKLERRSKRDGATRSMMEELQSRLPKNHEYTEDVSVSTDGLNFISSQLTKGYELLTDASGKPETNRIAINGESITNPLGEDVLREGDAFQDIRVTNQKQFERVRSYLSPLMEKFGAGLTSKNIFWENGRVYVDMPVLRKVNTDQASESSTDTPLTKTSKGNAVNQTNEVTTPVTPAPAPAPDVAQQQTPTPDDAGRGAAKVSPEPTAKPAAEVTLPVSKFSPLNNALARNKNLIQSLASLGVEVKVVKDGAAAEAFIGRKMKRRGGRGFTTRTAAGVPVIVLLEDRIVTNRANLDKLIQHEAIHAAHFAMRSADATMDDAAITELLSDTTLQRKMSRIYKGFEDLAPESQIAEVVVALNLGTLTTAQVPSSLLDYIAQFLAYMQGNLVNVSPEIKTLVDSVLGKLQAAGEGTLQNTVDNTSAPRTNPTPDDAGIGAAEVSPEPVAATAAEGVTPGPVAPTLEEVRARDSEAARLSREGGDTIEDETLVSDYLDGNTGPLMSRLREVGDVNLDLYPGPQGIDVATEAVNEVLTEMQSEGVPLSDEDVTRLTEAYRSEVTPTPPVTFDPDTTPLDASPVVRQPKQTRGALDDQYFAAIEAGDMEAVQRMVDEARFVPREVFYVKDIEVIRNPTDADYRQLSNDYRNEFPLDRSGDPPTRFTTDIDGNRWIWRSDMGTHYTVEPLIEAKEGKSLGQNRATTNWKLHKPITYDAQGNIIPLSQRFNPNSDSILEAQTSTNFTPDTDWTDVVTSLVNRAIQKYPNIPIRADNTSSSLARTQGLDMTINPVMMAESTAGMGPAEAAQIIDKIIIHEATHRAALTDLDPEFPNQYAAQMTVDEKLDTARGYLHRSAYATDEAYNNAVREFAGVEGNTDARTVNFKLGHEALRMLSERMRTGYTTEETIAFLKMNPNLLQRAIRYLKAYVNRLKAWATTRKDPTLYAEMSTLNKAVWEMENGPHVERGAEPFTVPGSYVAPAPMPRTVFNSVLGREIAVAAAPVVGAPVSKVTDLAPDGVLYRAEETNYANPNAGALFYSGDRDYVDNYLGPSRIVRVTKLPTDVVDLRDASDRKEIRKWAKKEIARIQNSENFRAASAANDAAKWLNKGDGEQETSVAMANITLAMGHEAGLGITPGMSEKKFLDDTNREAITVRESISEYTGKPGDYSVAFRTPPPSVETLEASHFGKPSRVPIRHIPEDGKYKEGGWLTAAFRWDPRVFEMLQKARGRFQSLVKEAEFFHKDLNAQLKKAFGSKKDLWPVDTVNLALGNTDNRMTEANVEEIKRIKSQGLAAAQGNYLRARALAKQQDDAGMVADAALTRQDARATFDSAIAAYKDRARVYEDQARIDARVRAEADRDAAITSLPDDVQVTVRKMRLAIDALSAELVRSGALPDDLKATIDANQGLWLHRSYRIFDQENYAEWIQESKDPEAEQLRNKTLTFVRDDLIRKEADKQMAKNPGMTRAQAKINAATVVTNEDVTKAFNGFLHIADGGVKSLLAGATISKDVDALMKRGVIPKEIQELWGVYTDPTVNAAKSLGAVAHFVTQQEFLSNLVDLGTSEGWLSKEQYDANGERLFELAPNNGMSGRYNGSPSTQWAPLSGYYGPRALADAISATAKDLGGPAWLKTVMQLTGYSMASKTVLSWQSVMRNFWGNILFTVANGNALTWNAWKTMNKSRQAAWSNFYGSGSEATRARVKRMIELGVFGDAMTENLLRDLTNGFGSDKKAIRFFDKMAQKTFLSKLTGGANKVFKTSARFYSAPDEFWKVVAFEGEMGRVAKYMPNATVEEQEQEAARIVKSTMPTYSQAPEIVQLLRRNPFIAPFITFTTEVYRTSINTVKLTAGQIAEGHKTKNTALAMDGYQRLLGILLASAGVHGVTLLLRSMAGFDDKDEDDLRSHVPVWDENATLMILPTDRSDGKIDYMNVSYFNPYDVWSRPLRAFFRGLRDPDSGLLDTIGETIQELFDPVLSEQIFIGSVLDVARGVTLSGKELYDDQDTKIDKITQSLTHIFKQSLMPGTASSAERIIKASTGYVAPGSGRSYEKWNEIFSGTLGMKFSSIDTSSTLQFSAKQFKANRSDSIYTFSKPFKSNGTQSDVDIADAYIKANAKLKRSQLELYKKMTSAVRLGTMTQREALRQMQADGVTDEVVRDILQNRFRRYEPSTRDLNEAKRKGDKLGQDRIAIYRSVRDEVPPVEKLSEDEL